MRWKLQKRPSVPVLGALLFSVIAGASGCGSKSYPLVAPSEACIRGLAAFNARDSLPPSEAVGEAIDGWACTAEAVLSWACASDKEDWARELLGLPDDWDCGEL